MLNLRPKRLRRVLVFLTGLMVLKVVVGVVLKYGDYFPPNFESDFLHGRELYFPGSYRWAFYTHIAAGPITLILGMILISERFRRTFPKWHRYLGRIQVPVVLFLVAPSGLWMAYHAEAGPVAGLGFATLAVLTGTSIALGWRSAVKRRFTVHRRWMWRCFLLLCSTVVLRLIAGLAMVTGVQGAWVEPLTAWVSWLVPLAAFELSGPIYKNWALRASQKSATLSPPATEISERRVAAGSATERNRTLPSQSAACIPPV